MAEVEHEDWGKDLDPAVSGLFIDVSVSLLLGPFFENNEAAQQ